MKYIFIVNNIFRDRDVSVFFLRQYNMDARNARTPTPMNILNHEKIKAQHH